MGNSCSNCGQINVELTNVNGKDYCKECLNRLFVQCADCGEWVDENDTYCSPNGEVCEDCWRTGYVSCEHCGNIIERDEAYLVSDLSGNGIALCGRCNRLRTETCESCGARFYDPYEEMDRDDECLCDDCYNERQQEPPRKVMPYSYKPNPIFMPCYTPLTPYMGIELEVDSDRYVSDLDSLAANVIDELDYVYVKHDGSLDNGMEIVTHPATLEYHTVTKAAAWKRAMGALLDEGLTSHDVGTCGLHVHVSLDAIESKDHAIVGKLIIAIDRFWDEMVKFTRRTKSQLDHWAKRYAVGRVNETSLIRLKGMAKGERDRYMALNLQNAKTVEFRLFRGTLNWSTFVATLQFVETIIDNLSAMDYAQIQSMTWADLVKSDFEELNAYLKLRGIAPNAPEAAAEPDEPSPARRARGDIRVGDIVRFSGKCTDWPNRVPRTEIGTVVIVDNNGARRYDALVEFERAYTALHGGNNSTEQRLGDCHYWWFNREYLIPVSTDN